MNHVYRTFTRCAGYAGILGCYLAGSAAIAGPGIGTYTDSAKTVRFNAMAGGSYIQTPSTTHVYVRATGKWTSFQDGVSRYKDLTVPVQRSTLRKGALAVLGRGVMHPGLHLAIAAAGWAWSQSDGIFAEHDYSGVVEPFENPNNCSFQKSGTSDYYDDPLSATIKANGARPDFEITFNRYNPEPSGCIGGLYEVGFKYTCAPTYCTGKSTYYTKTNAPTHTGGDDPYKVVSPVSPDDYGQLDEYIPPELADELWRGEPIPEWQDEISVLGQPASQVDSGTRNQPAEVASAVGKWAENLSAQYNGDAQPHPDGETGGQSAADQQYDEQQQEAEEPIPPFPEEEVNWQTEVLTLPSFSSGIGSGSCPGSQAISLPMGHSMTIEYTPACDLATMVRPALVGVCGIIALLIVLRARGGA